MKRDLHLRLIYKSLKGKLSDQEQEQLDTWVKQKNEHQKLRDQITQEWELSEQYEPELQIDTKADYQQLRTRIRQHEQTSKTASARIIGLSPQWLSIAASILLLLGLGWWFWPTTSISTVNTVAQTGANETRELILADGSTVWLNENSKLSFPNQFSEETRSVQLEGEAFFSVKPNAEVPFRIQIPGGPEVEVLGTSFLVQAQSTTENVIVEVASGKVRLSDFANDQQVVLQAGDRGKWSGKAKTVAKETEANANIYSWQNNTLFFSKAPLDQVIQDIERHFSITIEVENPAILDCAFSGRFPNAQLEEVLSAIGFSLGLEWKLLDGKNYEIRGEGC